MRSISLPDGRSLELHEGGDPDGFPIVVHHGTPSSGLLYEKWATEGVRLVGFDRAGYGGSTRDHGRDIAAVVADVEALADALGLEENVEGWVDDDLAFASPWGFELDAIRRPVLVIQGGDDRFVPASHGAWLAAHVPGCEAWLDDAHGHLTLLEDLVPDVHAWLLEHS